MKIYPGPQQSPLNHFAQNIRDSAWEVQQLFPGILAAILLLASLLQFYSHISSYEQRQAQNYLLI